MPSTLNDWYCIVNPHAGSGKTMPQWAVAEELLTASSISYKTVLTNYKYHATELAYDAAVCGYRKILAVGGDGSVHECLNGILRYTDESGADPEEFTLAVIPIGSGNDWIKSLGIPHDTRTMIDLIASGDFAREDVVRVQTSGVGVSYMANIGGVGFDSHVCERVNALKDQGKRGKLIYLGALIYTVFHTKAFHTRIVADGEVVFDGQAYSVAFGNGRYSGGGMRQVPMSEIDDGVLDYMIVPKAGLLRILFQIPRLYNGSVNRSGLLKTGRCKILEMGGDNIVEIDGEIVGSLPLRLSMTGRQIRVPVGKPA